MGRVLPQAVFEGLNQRDYTALWKLVAYAGGEFVLEAFVRIATAPNRPSGPDGVNAFCKTQSDNTQYRGRLANTWSMPCPMRIPGCSTRRFVCAMDEIRAATGSSGSPNEYVAHIDAMMKVLPFGIGMEGRTAIGTRSVGPAPPDEAGGREPRAFESILVRSGITVPALEGMPPPAYPDRPL